MEHLSKKLNRYTKIPEKKRKKTLKWLVNQNEKMMLAAFEEQKKHLFKLSRANESNKSLIYLSAIYLSADYLFRAYHGQNSKTKVTDINLIPDATRLQAKRIKKHFQSEKYDRLMNLKNKILVLKDEENLSFRELSEFLKRYHQLEVSHSYIATFYHETKEKK